MGRLLAWIRALARGVTAAFGRAFRGARAWARGSRLRQAALVLPLLGFAGWAAWIGMDRTGVRAGLEDALRDVVAMHRVRGYRDELKFAGAESGVDPYLLAGVLWAESSGRIDAISSAGALGLFQLKPITYEWRAELMGLPIPTREDILSDALLSARIGANNIAWLLDTYDGDVERMLLAYNAGPGRLASFVNEAGSWEAFRAERRAAGDSALFAYADKVQRYAEAFRAKSILDDDAEFLPPILNAPE